MKRSLQVSAPLVATVALGLLSACRRPEMQRCVDENNRVVDDAMCKNIPLRNSGGGGYGGGGMGFYPYRYYYGGGGGYGLGSSVYGGALAPAAGHSYASPTARGGFGSTHGGGGEGGGEGGGHGGGGGE